jgi:putative tryptophan/tyrosine transport system substrate-binding protein
MDRRTFICTVAGGMLAAPIDAAVEQAGKVYRIGWLTLGSGGASDPNLPNFRRGLSELGWIEGRNIAIVARYAESQPDRLPILAAELVALKVDVIVTVTTTAALAAKKATALIPIVMAGSGDPVERGLVKSLARPSGNVTGVTNNPGAGFYPKMLQLLKDAAPRVSRVAVLWTMGLEVEEATFKEIQAAVPALGLTVFDA